MRLLAAHHNERSERGRVLPRPPSPPRRGTLSDESVSHSALVFAQEHGLKFGEFPHVVVVEAAEDLLALKNRQRDDGSVCIESGFQRPGGGLIEITGKAACRFLRDGDAASIGTTPILSEHAFDAKWRTGFSQDEADIRRAGLRSSVPLSPDGRRYAAGPAHDLAVRSARLEPPID